MLTELETKILAMLRENAESEYEGEWWQVYLDNVNHGLTDRQFSGVLGSLTQKGYYQPQGDGIFGNVKMG